MWIRADSSPSCFFLGSDRVEERAAAEYVGGPVPLFFALTQRCIWGLCQPDLVQVDVQRALRRLERSYPECFVTHLITAFATRLARPARAEEALIRARELCGPNHPWRYLLPSDADWRGEVPPQDLIEVLPNRMWRVRVALELSGTPFKVSSIATLVRAEDARLVLINPVALEPSILARVRALGTVCMVAQQGRSHSRYVDCARAQFPEARVLGSPGHLVHPPSAHVRFDGILGTCSGSLPDEFQTLPVEGTQADEVVLLHRPTRTLIAQDLLANNRSDNLERSFGGRLYYFAWGLCDRIGMHGYQPLLWQDLERLQSCLRRLASADYARVTAAHWPIAPCAGEELEDFREQLSRLAALSRWQHLALRARFVRFQPGFVVDLLRYNARQKRARRALAAVRPQQDAALS